MHSLHDTILESGLAYLSLKATVGDITWSGSRRVDCVLCRRIQYMILYWRLAQFICYCKPQWMTLNGQTVVGLTVFFVYAFAKQAGIIYYIEWSEIIMHPL